MSKSSVNSSSKNYIMSIVVLLVVAILFGFILLQGVSIKQDKEMISISGGLLYSAKISYTDITNIELRDSIEYGTRINGASLFNYKLGIFSNNEFNKYKLFADKSIRKFIVATYGEGIVVFNGKDEATTVDIYNSLLEKSGLK